MTTECRKVRHRSIEAAGRHRDHLAQIEAAAGEGRGAIGIYRCDQCSTEEESIYTSATADGSERTGPHHEHRHR